MTRVAPIMPPSKNHFAFLHIQKSAGSTFNDILRAQFDESDICPAVQMLELKQYAGSLDQYRLFSGHFRYAQFASIREHCNMLTILRDPVERVISNYAHVMRDTTTAKRSPLMADVQFEALTLEQYVFDERMKQAISNRAVSLFGDGDLEKAIKRLDKFEFVGITEAFDQSVALLCHTFGWQVPVSYTNRRVAQNRPTPEAISQHVRQQLEQLNELDRRLYDHAATLFRQRCEDSGMVSPV